MFGYVGHFIVITTAQNPNSDEAHCVKKLTGSYYNMTRLFSWERLVWVTGTPHCSLLRDILAPLNMMWDKYNCEWEPDSAEIGNLANLYSPDYDPTDEEGFFDREGGGRTCAIFGSDYLEKHPELKPVEEAYRDCCHVRLWMLCPCLLEQVAKKISWGTYLGSRILAQIMRMLQINRKMHSFVTVPAEDGDTDVVLAGLLDDDEEPIVPGKRIYPATNMILPVICVEKVGFKAGSEEETRAKQHLIDYSRKLFGPCSEGVTDHTTSDGIQPLASQVDDRLSPRLVYQPTTSLIASNH